ncbi:MAG TPA: cytochrome b/b6 domain-containing protein [Nocardioides sp.]|nr:cytochrome b/b6 domain-containing protein [Nocardioides sp.]
MPLRNGEHGYGLVTKTVHWGSLALMAVQFTVGYTMDADAGTDAADDRLDAREDRCESENDAAEERCDDAVDRQEDALEDEEYSVFDGSFDALDLHVVLGLTILALAVLRTLWRIGTPLPPWAERLTPLDRRLAHATEVALITTQYVLPLSGLWLVLSNDDSMLPLHVVGHVTFFVALAVHVGLVLRRGLLTRML